MPSKKPQNGGIQEPEPETPQEPTETSIAPENRSDDICTENGEENRETEPVLDPEPAVEAVLVSNQCPGCGHVNEKPSAPIGRPRRIAESGVWNGTPYQTVKKTLIECEKCRTIYFSKEYL